MRLNIGVFSQIIHQIYEGSNENECFMQFHYVKNLLHQGADKIVVYASH